MSKMSTKVLETQEKQCPHGWRQSDDGDLGEDKDRHVCCPECFVERKQCDDCLVGIWSDDYDIAKIYESDKTGFDICDGEHVEKFKHCPICGRKL